MEFGSEGTITPVLAGVQVCIVDLQKAVKALADSIIENYEADPETDFDAFEQLEIVVFVALTDPGVQRILIMSIAFMDEFCCTDVLHEICAPSAEEKLEHTKRLMAAINHYSLQNSRKIIHP